MVEFIAVISLIAGILQIVLFFKVWGMTNDIRELKKDHFSDLEANTDFQKAIYVRRNLIVGEKDKAKYLLLKEFLSNISRGYDENESIRPYVETLRKQLSKIGEELPEYISKLETLGDYRRLFTKDDFKIVAEES